MRDCRDCATSYNMTSAPIDKRHKLCQAQAFEFGRPSTPNSHLTQIVIVPRLVSPSAINFENFMIKQWEGQNERGETDRMNKKRHGFINVNRNFLIHLAPTSENS